MIVEKPLSHEKPHCCFCHSYPGDRWGKHLLTCVEVGKGLPFFWRCLCGVQHLELVDLVKHDA